MADERDDEQDPERGEPDEDDTSRAPRKERVLHTRVPAVLEQELKRLAKNLRVPVSNVVRTILEDALETMETVGRRAEDELHDATDRLASRRAMLRDKPPRRRRSRRSPDVEPDPVRKDDEDDPLAGVLGFTPIVLARATRCAVTGQRLAAGEHALTGIDERTNRRIVVARDVLSRDDPEDDPNQEEDS